MQKILCVYDSYDNYILVNEFDSVKLACDWLCYCPTSLYVMINRKSLVKDRYLCEWVYI